MIHGMKAELSEHYTAPQKQYTEDSLLSAMETAGNEHFDEDTEKKGIGTPATRASIIEKLVKFNYVIRKGKQLIPTEDGIRLIKILPEEIKSPKLTADWENQLLQIERGHELSENFLKKIQGNLKNLTNKYSEETLDKDVSFNSNSNRESLGKCPRCGSDVYEGQKAFYCCNNDCSFALYKVNKWLSSVKKTLNGKMTMDLLKSGRTHLKGLYSRKKDKTFDADIVLDDTGQYVNFKLEFSQRKDDEM